MPPAMLAEFHSVVGPSTANWLLVIVCGVIFLAGAALLPDLVRRCRGKNAPPLP
jgi:hypothetical protein